MGALRNLGRVCGVAVAMLTVAAHGQPVDMWDPFRAPVPDRLPDDYVKNKPYWRAAARGSAGTRSPSAPASVSKEDSTIAPAEAPVPARAASLDPQTAMAADQPVEPYDPYQRPTPDRIPDDYVNGRPYWLPRPTLQATPTGFRGYSLWEAQIGGRYFASSGRTKYDLFRPDLLGVPQPQISRLTYDGLIGHSGEVFGRLEHAQGYFVKGFVGIGGVTSGTLHDEDFPPFGGGLADLYSNTTSSQHGGSLAYGALDLGWNWRTSDFKLGFFAGYAYYSERLDAFGCTQTAFNPAICAPGDVAPGTRVIRQDTRWDAARLGFSTDWRFYDGWNLSTDVAWLPYVNLSARDSHFLRPDLSGPIVQTGFDALSSVQLEAILGYRFVGGVSVGAGLRYWNIHVNPRHATFTFNTVVGPVPEPATLVTQRWGAFLQASYQFGNLQPSGRPSSTY